MLEKPEQMIVDIKVQMLAQACEKSTVTEGVGECPETQKGDGSLRKLSVFFLNDCVILFSQCNSIIGWKSE